MNIFENKALQLLLTPLSLIYEIIIRLRNLFYDFQIFPIYRLQKVKVISIGNVTVGGTGKTPFCEYLAQELKKNGHHVAIISRGYGRQTRGTIVVSNGKEILCRPEESGDEPFLLAQNLTNIPVICKADRYQGGLFVQQHFQPDIIILDDGFQHRRLHRDLNIVLVDATRGFGNGKTLPGGFLREPVSSLKRADLICLTHVHKQKSIDRLVQKIQSITSSPILKTIHEPCQLIQMGTNKSNDLSLLKNKKAFLFSGIANPSAFEKTISSLGSEICYHLKYKDHYRYTERDLKRIFMTARKYSAELIVTTEKDAVRLASYNSLVKNFFYLKIKIKIIEGFNDLDRILQHIKII